uniref:Uncharacterized protein n=1 Tax=Panagrolaimus superbus TaxID=310955 RepID=A0A914Y6S8_9BILA
MTSGPTVAATTGSSTAPHHQHHHHHHQQQTSQHRRNLTTTSGAGAAAAAGAPTGFIPIQPRSDATPKQPRKRYRPPTPAANSIGTLQDKPLQLETVALLSIFPTNSIEATAAQFLGPQKRPPKKFSKDFKRCKFAFFMGGKTVVDILVCVLPYLRISSKQNSKKFA